MAEAGVLLWYGRSLVFSTGEPAPGGRDVTLGSVHARERRALRARGDRGGANDKNGDDEKHFVLRKKISLTKKS